MCFSEQTEEQNVFLMGSGHSWFSFFVVVMKQIKRKVHHLTNKQKKYFEKTHHDDKLISQSRWDKHTRGENTKKEKEAQCCCSESLIIY